MATVADSKARRTPRRVTEDYKAWLVLDDGMTVATAAGGDLG